MRFSIDVEMTPEELRRALGLPDLSAFQDDVVEQVREQMASGTEGYDPWTLLQPFLRSGMGSADAVQKMMMTMMNQYGRKKSASDEK